MMQASKPAFKGNITDPRWHMATMAVAGLIGMIMGILVGYPIGLGFNKTDQTGQIFDDNHRICNPEMIFSNGNGNYTLIIKNGLRWQASTVHFDEVEIIIRNNLGEAIEVRRETAFGENRGIFWLHSFEELNGQQQLKKKVAEPKNSADDTELHGVPDQN